MKIKFTFPVTEQQGTYEIVCKDSLMESAEQSALWHYNSARAHDGQPPLDELPWGTKREALAGNDE